MWTQRLALLLISISLLPSGAASASSASADHLVLGIVSTKTTQVFPLEPIERDIQSVYGIVYDSLIQINDDYRPVGRLASSWEPSNNGKTWTFTLREGVTFSDGAPLTADDVVATTQYILNKAGQQAEEGSDIAPDLGYYRNLAYFVSSVSKTDDKTVVFKTKRSYYGFLYALIYPILPADKLEMENPPGTGAYVIAALDPQRNIWLTARDNWWQTPPQVKSISVELYPSTKELISAYEYSQVDTAFTRSVSAAQYKSGVSSVSLDYRSRQLELLFINHKEQALQSVKVRAAVRHAINVDQIISQVYMGMADRADTPILPGTWLSKEYPGAFDYNPALAVQLLEEDGWFDLNEDGVRERVVEGKEKAQVLHINILVYEEPDSEVRVSAANAMADALTAVGFEIKVITDTREVIAEKLKARSFDLVLCSVNMDPVQDPGFLLMSGNTMNYMRYVNKDLDKLFSTLRTGSPTPEDYQSNLHQIQDVFAQDYPIITLYYRKGVVVSRKMYTGARQIRELELLRGIDEYGR